MFRLKQIVAISSLLFATSNITHAMPLDAISAESNVLSRLHAANPREIEVGTFAVTQALKPEVQNFGKALVTDHTACEAKVQEIAVKENIAIVADFPLTPEEKTLLENQRMHIDQLKTMRGEAFDKLFLRSAIDCHDLQIKFLNAQRPLLNNAAVIALVDQAIVKETAHRDLAAKLLAGF